MNRKEEEIMRLIWESDTPVTSIDIEERAPSSAGNRATIFRTIKSLTEKGLIEECGTELHGRQYARCFRAAVTKEQYLADYLLNSGVDERTLAQIAFAFVEKKKDKRGEKALIRELEAILEELKK